MKNYTVIPTEAAEKLPLNDLYVFTALCQTPHDDNTTDLTYEQLAGFTGKSLGYIKDHFAKRLKNSGLCTIEEFVRNSNRRKRYILPYVPEQFRIIHRGVLEEKKQYFLKFNVNGLMRGDYESRMTGYSIGRQNGWLSANDIREMEDMNPVPDEEGGNLYLVNGSMTKLKDAGAFAQKGETNET